MHAILKIIAVILGLFGTVMLVGTLGNIDMIPDKLSDWIGMVLAMNVLPIGLSIFLFRRSKKMAKDRDYRKYEAMVLKLAQDKGGILTVADVTVHTSMTYKEADSFLNEMYVHGVLDMYANAEGGIEYSLKA